MQPSWEGDPPDDGPGPDHELDAVVDAVLTGSRVLVAVAARSLGAVDGTVTLPQFRALVVLATRGPQPPGALARELQVVPSSVTRMTDRLVRRGLVSRRTPADDRREIELALTRDGRDIVDQVTRQRRREIRRIVEQIHPTRRRPLVVALEELARAAGEVPETHWSLGWT